MLRRQVLTLLVAGLLAAALVGGLIRLFELRLEHGDTYPPYSTLRTDPLGAKALYAAFQSQSGLSASRNYRSLPRLNADGPITLIYAGVTPMARWSDRELPVFDSLVSAGSRAVFTFLPEERRPKSARLWRTFEEREKEKEEKDAAKKEKTAKDRSEKGKDQSGKDDAGEEAKKKGKDDSEEEREAALGKGFTDVAKGWGVRFEVLRGDNKEPVTELAVTTEDGAGMEPEISWHSALYFEDLQPEWRVLYTFHEHPVIIERPWGKGSLVLAADSFFLSNEALRTERASRLLAWLVGPRNVVFDEEHQGISEEPNLAGLVRKYGLQGAVFGLLAVAALFVWQNVVRFVPPYGSDRPESDVVSGQDSSEGFVNLLRRTIAPSAILGVCVAEWRKSEKQKAGDAKMDAALALADGQEPVAAYAAIAAQLNRHD